jgi:hypothetical protein
MPGYCSTASSLKAKRRLVPVLLGKDFSCIYVLTISGEASDFNVLRLSVAKSGVFCRKRNFCHPIMQWFTQHSFLYSQNFCDCSHP